MKIHLFVGFIMCAGMSWAGEMTLKSVLAVARKENPEIVAARERWAAAKARIGQAATPDKPRVDFEHMYTPRGGSLWSDAPEKNVAVSQTIPFPTTLYWASRSARLGAEQAEADFQAKERDVIARVKTAYAMLYLSRHSIHIFEENVDLLRQLSKVAEAKYAVGKVSQGDALKAQVELSKMLNELVTLEQEKETNEAMLNTLLNRSPESPLGQPQDPEPRSLDRDLDALGALAVTVRPELRSAGLAVDRSKTQVALSRSDYLPDIMLQYRERNMDNGMDSRDAMVGVTLPLWFWKQNGMVREARAERAMAQADYQAMKNKTYFDVKNLLVKVQTARRMIDLYQTSVLPQAQQALKITEAAYRSDRATFLELLDSVRSLLQFRLEHYEHYAHYEQFMAALEQVVGVDLFVEEEKQ